MTTYILNLRALGGDEDDLNPALTTLADLRTADPAVMAATLRAVADRLDPPKPARPATRGRTGLIDFNDPAVRGAVVRVEPWMLRQAGTGCAGDACSEAHTYAPGCLLQAEPPADEPDVEQEHKPGCESVHAEGTPCLPPRRTRLTPDGCGPTHTHTGSCVYAVQERPK